MFCLLVDKRQSQYVFYCITPAGRTSVATLGNTPVSLMSPTTPSLLQLAAPLTHAPGRGQCCLRWRWATLSPLAGESGEIIDRGRTM